MTQRDERGRVFISYRREDVGTLYLHPMMREPLEIAVLAAGDRIAPNLKEPRTAAQDFDRVRAILEPRVPPTPTWFGDAYLCFYDDDNDFASGPASFASELNRLDDDGGVDFGRSELHVTTIARQAIARGGVSPVDKATLDMLALMTLGDLSALGISIGAADRTSTATLKSVFYGVWDLLSNDERYPIYKVYQRLTGGKDIRLEWGLPSHGLTFTIDRRESRGD